MFFKNATSAAVSAVFNLLFVTRLAVLPPHGRTGELRVQAHHGGDGGVWLLSELTGDCSTSELTAALVS